ncbi:polysaccharide biosynthesis tyrosine autokinase [Nocardioides seonyuensis]|uniref:Polysaccharide biosynthesis tyrosine autokinase n=1 Tax=Nocardioides seonyuensis TaxID=2518371 RepID=A0A4P7IGG9_9ACTN|nr:polysaccharide biosynthesis tyrosine autokinase [Nocardioides seonyuensis]QBX55860.1 polysaccharide biosynthesis tyrosine autokinase [Nocardioides seonyuensis]
MELTFYTRVLRNHWIAITAMVLVAAAAAFGWSSAQPKVYAANASGFVTSGGGGDVGLENLDDMLSKSRAASYVELAKDRATASLVIDELGLDTTASTLVGNIEVAQKPETVIIAITARAGTPQAAQDLADAWIAALATRVSSVEAEGSGKSAQRGGMRIEVSEAAELPTSPVAPQVERNVLLGAVLGALLGMGYAVARSLLDRRIRSVEDVERHKRAPVAGTVLDVGSHTGLFVTTPNGAGQASLAAEGMRRLRTNLSYMDVDNPPRALVITSPKQGDGKSTIAANLAATIAQSGQPVTLVDADLRRPRVAGLLGLDDAVGLTDVLTGRLDLADALQPHPDLPGFRILTSGPRPPNPTEILDSNAMRRVIEELRSEGMVIIDAPPLLPVTDAAVLALETDGALVTVSAGRTLDTDLTGALGHLDAVHARALGVVLNKVSKRTVGAGNYAYYGYDAYRETRKPKSERVKTVQSADL